MLVVARAEESLRERFQLRHGMDHNAGREREEGVPMEIDQISRPSNVHRRRGFREGRQINAVMNLPAQRDTARFGMDRGRWYHCNMEGHLIRKFPRYNRNSEYARRSANRQSKN